MALSEVRDGASPHGELPQKDAGNLAIIFKDLNERFGEGFVAPAIVEYIKGDDDEGKKESKVLAKMPRGLAPNEVLVVTFTPNTIAGTTNAFIYAVPEELDTKEVELMGAMHLEKY